MMKSRYAAAAAEESLLAGIEQMQPAHYSRSKKGIGSIMRARRKQHKKDKDIQLPQF